MRLLKLARVDRTDGAEQLRREVVQRIVAHVYLRLGHARELVLALGEVVMDVPGHVGLDGHVGVRQGGVLLRDCAIDLRQHQNPLPRDPTPLRVH